MNCILPYYSESFVYDVKENLDNPSNDEVEVEEIFEEPSFDYLPMELVINILKYLNGSDLKYAGLVCRKWLVASRSKKFIKNMMFNFTDTYYKEFSVQISSFTNPFRIIPAVSLSTKNLDVASKSFWTEYGGNIKELYFINIMLEKLDFEEIVRYTPHLEVLKVERNSLFNRWDIKESYQERLIQFHKCRLISLSNNQYLSKKLLKYFLGFAPNLQEIDLSSCLHKVKSAEKNMLLDHLIFYLKGYADNIKVLNLENTKVDDFFLHKLSEVRGLKLKTLHLTFNGCTNNKKYGILPLLASQTEMEHLYFNDSPAVEENVLVQVSKFMKKIKTIKLKKCPNLTDYCVRELCKFMDLEAVDITGCELISSEGLYDGLIYGRPKTKFRELSIGYLPKITDDILFKMGPKYEGQITYLDLRGLTTISDSALQMIIDRFPNLRYLNVDSCCKFSDYGFTGKDKLLGNTNKSIGDLKGLKTFRCSNIFKLTDKSLECFKFLEMKDLCISRCHISMAGVEAVVKNCPSIETFDLSECEKVDDETVEIITKYLSRIQTLKLNGCEKLTDRIFDHIYENCKEIKNLYLRNCPNLKTDRITDQLYYMRTLRRVVVDV